MYTYFNGAVLNIINGMLRYEFEYVDYILKGSTNPHVFIDLNLLDNLGDIFGECEEVWEEEKLEGLTGLKYKHLEFRKELNEIWEKLMICILRMDSLLNKCTSSEMLEALKNYVKPELYEEMKTLSLMGGDVRAFIIKNMDFESLTEYDWQVYNTNTDNSKLLNLGLTVANSDFWESFLALESIEVEGL